MGSPAAVVFTMAGPAPAEAGRAEAGTPGAAQEEDLPP